MEFLLTVPSTFLFTELLQWSEQSRYKLDNGDNPHDGGFFCLFKESKLGVMVPQHSLTDTQLTKPGRH